MFPNKVTNLKNSILWKLPDLAEESQKCNSIFELYKNTTKWFSDSDEFLLSLDILYLLEVIDVKEGGELEYVKRNNM